MLLICDYPNLSMFLFLGFTVGSSYYCKLDAQMLDSSTPLVLAAKLAVGGMVWRLMLAGANPQLTGAHGMYCTQHFIKTLLFDMFFAHCINA